MTGGTAEAPEAPPEVQARLAVADAPAPRPVQFAPVDDDPLGLLLDLVACAATGRPLAPATARWLASGVRLMARQGDTLDAALGLSLDGRRSPRRRLLLLRRDLHLVAAARAVAADDALPAWERCTRLAPLVRRFMSDVWPRMRHCTTVPADWPAWRREIHAAARRELGVPQSAQGLYDAIKRATPWMVDDGRARVLAELL